MANEEQQPMSATRLAEIGERVEAATKGYWIAGTLGGDLMYRGALGPARIARIDATDGHKGVADLLYHAYDDLSVLLSDNERLRAREAEWDSKEQALQKSIAEHGRVIAKLEARLEEQGDYNHQLVRRLVDALEIVRAVAEAPIEVAKFGTVNKTQMRVLCLRSDVRHVQEQARALLASADEAK